MKSIFSYSDYRSYLKAKLQERKQQANGFSYARFSALLGLGSPNHSQLIIEGKRSLTLANAHHAADALELNEDERQYLELLVIQESVSEPRHLRRIKDRAKKMRMNKPQSSRKILKPGNELNQWYLPAVLVYFAGKSEATSVESASRFLSIGKKEVESGLALLLEQGLLTIQNEHYTEVAQILWTDRKGMGRSQRAYLSHQLDQSRVAFNHSYDRGAKFGAHTFTVPVSDMAVLADRFESLVQSLVTEMDQPENQEVVQINFQIFNLKHLKKGEAGSR